MKKRAGRRNSSSSSNTRSLLVLDPCKSAAKCCRFADRAKGFLLVVQFFPSQSAIYPLHPRGRMTIADTAQLGVLEYLVIVYKYT
ncbi:unnamed protein product [Trichogramma brassicae]|uniref:Uncharacterized protein n=1 Tax=Trichogramma brassicae TaxID=86971 RepID=A0A6H5I3I7_9HYME|nr:unnamed protein product [Trichogramma brassicae]